MLYVVLVLPILALGIAVLAWGILSTRKSVDLSDLRSGQPAPPRVAAAPTPDLREDIAADADAVPHADEEQDFLETLVDPAPDKPPAAPSLTEDPTEEVMEPDVPTEEEPAADLTDLAMPVEEHTEETLIAEPAFNVAGDLTDPVPEITLPDPEIPAVGTTTLPEPESAEVTLGDPIPDDAVAGSDGEPEEVVTPEPPEPDGDAPEAPEPEGTDPPEVATPEEPEAGPPDEPEAEPLVEPEAEPTVEPDAETPEEPEVETPEEPEAEEPQAAPEDEAPREPGPEPGAEEPDAAPEDEAVVANTPSEDEESPEAPEEPDPAEAEGAEPVEPEPVEADDVVEEVAEEVAEAPAEAEPADVPPDEEPEPIPDRPFVGSLASAELNAVYERCAVASLARQLAFQELVGGRPWTVDLQNALLVFGSGDDRAEYPLNVLGSIDPEGTTFLWAWANPAVPFPDAVLEAGRALGAQDIPELREERFAVDEPTMYALFVVQSTLDGRPYFFGKSRKGGPGVLFLVDQPVRVDRATLVRALEEFPLLGPTIEDAFSAVAAGLDRLDVAWTREDGAIAVHHPTGDLRVLFDASGRLTAVRASDA